MITMAEKFKTEEFKPLDFDKKSLVWTESRFTPAELKVITTILNTIAKNFQEKKGSEFELPENVKAGGRVDHFIKLMSDVFVEFNAPKGSSNLMPAFLKLEIDKTTLDVTQVLIVPNEVKEEYDRSGEKSVPGLIPKARTSTKPGERIYRKTEEPDS